MSRESMEAYDREQESSAERVGGGRIDRLDANSNEVGEREALPGEPGIPNIAEARPSTTSKKGVLALVLFVATVASTGSLFVARHFSSDAKPDEGAGKRVADRPAATGELKRLDMSAPVASAASAAPQPTAPRVPALQPTVDESSEPIGVRRTGQSTPPSGGSRPVPPEDAPAVLVSTRPGAANGRTGNTSSVATAPDGEEAETSASRGQGSLDETRRSLQGYQKQLQGMLDNLTRTTAATSAQGNGAIAGVGSAIGSLGRTPVGGPPTGGTTSGPSSGGGLFGGSLPGSHTPKVGATLLENRSLTLPKGTAFTCALKTRIVSAASGFVSCLVQRNVYSEDGRVLLIERGSHMDGEYRIASVRPGTVRIPVLWTRIRTPNAVTVDIESPGTGPLGESGVEGYVDNRWFERIGAAMLLSLIDDSVKLVIQNQSNQNGGNGDTLVLPSTTANGSKLAEKVLDSTINIPPLIYQNQGGIVGIYVARDVDFSGVYALQPVEREERR